MDAGGNPIRPIVVTTPGRMMIAQILPKHPDVPFDLINRQLTKKSVSDVIDMVYRHCGQKECVIFADRLMGLGLCPGGEGGHFVRQGRPDHPGQQGRADPAAPRRR